MPQWTEDQQKVISSSSGRLICSAAAGSGKTTVMIERIVRLIREGADPFSFLVITFTNAAAAEMKEKIRKRLLEERKDPVIAAAAEKSAAMEVCTIHAFCQHLIRQEFQVVRVDPLFGICTGAQREKLFEDAFRRACNTLRRRKDEDYLAFIRAYDPKSAMEIVTQVWQFIMSLPEPFVWLREKAENIPVEVDPDHPWFRTVSRMVNEKILSLRVILRRQAEMFDEYEKQEAYRAVFVDDLARVDALCRWQNGEAPDASELKRNFMRMPALRGLTDLEIDWKERYNNLRDELKKRFGETLGLIFPDGDRMKKEFTGIRNTLRGLVKLTEETHKAYEENKAKIRSLDFTDLEHKALEILKDEACRAAVHSRWQRIFVDECQDVSSVQDKLIQKLAGEENTLFMVGDVKQSIYRFRLANPKLFQDRIEAKGPEAGEVIYLQENYRSRPEVLETANTIFRDVMRRAAAEIEYRPVDELRCGRQDCAGSVPVCVDLVKPAEGKTRLETVADHVAEQIRGLTGGEGGAPQFGFEDIVILMPEVSTDGPKLSEMLKERGIPVFFDGKGAFFDQPEVEAFRNLLAHLDEPHTDLPLLTVLVNPPFFFTEEELSLIRLKDMGRGRPFWQAFAKAAEEDSPLGEKCRRAKETLDEWNFLSVHMKLSDLLWYLADNSFMYAWFGAKEHGSAAQKNLRTLCMQADAASERGIHTLREFLNFLSEQASGGEMQAASSLGKDDRLVRIMTMHKSKGLQFPVVFCVGLEKGLTGKPGGIVRLDEDLGICLRYKDPKVRLSRKTAADSIFEWKKEHDVKAEKICLLYVAVTRAQEKLFLVGTDQERSLWDMPSGDHRTLAASDYLDLILPALKDEEKKSTTFAQGSKPWNIRIFDGNQQESVETGKVIHNLEEWVKSVCSEPAVDELWKTDQEENAPDQDEQWLKKYSVTTVLRRARNLVLADEEEQTPEEKRTPDYVQHFLYQYRMGRISSVLLPQGAKKEDAALRGTMVHRFLSLMDLEPVRQAGGAGQELLLAQLEGFMRENVFTREDAALVRTEMISRFFASDIGRRLLASPEAHREWCFNLLVKERGMIVQGMIDCAFREGDGWILLDYKTDRITDENAFVEEYRPQLEWYTVALQELTGLPVKERWLYALSVDKAYRVE